MAKAEKILIGVIFTALAGIVIVTIWGGEPECIPPYLMPQPKNLKCGAKTIEIKDCIGLKTNSNDKRFNQDLEDIYSDMFIRKADVLKFGTDCKLNIDVTIDNDEDFYPSGFDTTYESYTLKADSTGTVKIDALYKVGVLRAMDTLGQLFEYSSDTVSLPNIPITIEDEPRYAYRGLMFDIAREFFSLDTLKQLMRGLRMAKINVVHFHLTDDDSFPIDLPSFEGLVDYTAFSKEEVYKQEDIQELIEYAKFQGIKIIPEVDVPGHSHVIGNDPKYKDIVTCYGRPFRHSMEDGGYIHGGPGNGALNPAMDGTYEYVKTIIQDLTTVFSNSEFYHMGGDEVIRNWWLNDTAVQQFMKDHDLPDFESLFQYFNLQVEQLASEITKKPLGHWANEDTTYINWGEGPNVLEYWGLSDNITKAIEKYPNSSFVLSPVDKFYFDCGYGDRYGGSKGCHPISTWVDMRLFEPTDYFSENDERLLGGEAWMWNELNTPYNIYNKIFPRIGMLSDVFWGPKMDEFNHWNRVAGSIIHFRDHLEANGIPANKVGSQYCEMNFKQVFGYYKKKLKYDNIIDEHENFINGTFKDHKKKMAEEYNKFLV